MSNDLYWAYNLPLQVWPGDEEGDGEHILNYMPRKERCCDLSISELLEDGEETREEFFLHAARNLRGLADDFERYLRGEIDHVYYPTDIPKPTTGGNMNTENTGPRMRAALARLDAIESRQTATESRQEATEKRVAILEAESDSAPTTTPRFTTATWQDGFPFDPEELFGDVDTHRYQTTVAWIQVLVPDGNRYGMAVVALGDRNHDGLYRQGSGGTGRGYHLFHDRRFGRGELWDEQTNYSSFLIRDGKLWARPLGNIPGVKPFNVEVTGLRFGSTIDEGDHEADYAVGVPSYLADLQRNPETAVAAVLIRKRSGAGDNSFWPKPEVAAIQIDAGGDMFLSVGGAFKSELGNPADDYLIDLEGGRVVTHGSRVEADYTDAIRWDVRGLVPGWPSS